MRKEVPEVGWGDFVIIASGDRSVLIMRYDWRNNSVLFVHNLDARPRDVAFSVGLDEKDGFPAVKLTLAERKRLEIARALATRPRLLLLDEPTAGLNPVEVDAALALFGQIRAGGVTVVIVEHNVRAVRALCDRVIVLNSGKKIAEGAPAEALEHAAVVEVYLGRA